MLAAPQPGRPVVLVVGLGPAGPVLMTGAARSAIEGASAVLVRTARHEAAGVLVNSGARALDRCYEESESFDDAYRAIAEEVIAAACANGSVVYAVPGSPLVLERSVELIRRDDRVETEIVGGLSFLDLAWERLGIDPVTSGVRLVDAEDFAVHAAGERGPFLVAQCWHKGLLSEVKLAGDQGRGGSATVLHHLGHRDELVLEVQLAQLDQCVEADHLTCVFLPQLAAPVGPGLAHLDEVMRVLRQRCPWDAKQTHQSLAGHLLEEAYEVIEAVEGLGPFAGRIAGAGVGSPLGELPGAPSPCRPDPHAASHLEEELGDLLVQVLFHARLAAEEGLFDLGDVAKVVTEKLVRRHPHVFAPDGALLPSGAGLPGEGGQGSVGEEQLGAVRRVEQAWEEIKRDEKGRTGLLEGIPPGLPALMLASKLERKARGVELGWAVTGPSSLELVAWMEMLLSGATEPAGELLLGLARQVAHLGGDPEELTRQAAGKMRRQLEAAEDAAGGGIAGLLSVEPEARAALYRSMRPGAAG